ncbi:MAG: branched chain amino acid aminotransferase, partial [Clostridia bacterium]|nr:branched chain amino acid aminotransferase [Clostridia bacterium]
LSIDEVEEAYKNGKLNEAFGTGTAAVISPIGELYDEGYKMIINNNEIGKIAQRLYNELTGIQWGKVEDEMNWIVKVN